MIVDNYFDQWNLDFAACDYRSGAEQVMNYLLQLGHRKIGLLSAAQEIHTARDVTAIYTERLTAAGSPPAAGWVEDGKFTEEGGALRDRKSSPSIPTSRPSSPATTRWRSARCII